MSIYAKAFEVRISDAPYLIVTGSLPTPTDQDVITFEEVEDLNPNILTLIVKIKESDRPRKISDKPFIHIYSGVRLGDLKQVSIRMYDTPETINIVQWHSPF